MKKKNRLLIITVLILSIIIFHPITCSAWEVESTSISNIVVRDGRLESFDFHFELPQGLGETQSWLGFQAVKFDADDLMDNGNIYGNYASIRDVKRDDDFLWKYKIGQFSENSFSCFGIDHTSLTETLTDFSIDIDESGIYYVYLWTQDDDSFYPDALLATVTFDNGLLKVTGPSGEELIDETLENLEAPVVDKIEIVDVNLELAVGKAPTFSAKIKNNSDKFNFEETFMSTDRISRFESADSDIDEEDRFVKDLKYYHISDIYIKDNVNLKFDENTKVYINGVEQSKDRMYVSNYWISVADENDVIIPEGYIAPAYLDKDFEEEQKEAIKEIILKAAKNLELKYNSDEIKDLVNAAIQNGDLLDVDVNLYISESITKSLSTCFFDEEIINALNNEIGKDYKIAAYYGIFIEIYVNHSSGEVTELTTPILLTIPYPNGVPALSDGYKRTWKIARYHDGKVDILDAEQTENGISFENDKLSIYALVYQDTKMEESNNPQTGDDIMPYISIFGLSIVGLIGIGLFLKKKKDLF